MTVYAKGFVNWWNDFIQRIGDFFAGNAANFSVFERILLAVVVIVIGWLLATLYKAILRKCLKLNKKMGFEKKAGEMARGFIITLITFIHWLIFAVLVLGVLGVNFSSSAGIISAIAVALGLALQDVIGCFAAGLIVLVTRPIEIGEYVMIKNDYGECEGTVKKVGLMMTELNTFNGHNIYIPNSNIQKSIVTNVNRDPYRRIEIAVTIAYDSDIDLAREVLTNLAKNDECVEKEKPIQLIVFGFEESGVKVELRCWTLDEKYWDTKFRLNEAVLKTLRENNIKIPYKTITIDK